MVGRSLPYTTGATSRFRSSTATLLAIGVSPLCQFRLPWPAIAIIYDLKVWTQELAHLVKQKLVEWSNFPEEKVFELLEWYDVSLQRGWTFPWQRTEEKYDDPKFGS